MDTLTRQRGYSSQVKLSLIIDGVTVDVEQINGKKITLRGPELPKTSTTDATLVIEIDGAVESHEIVIFHGLNGTRHVDYM